MSMDTDGVANSSKRRTGVVSKSAMFLLALAAMPGAVTSPASAATPGEMMALCRNRAHDVLKIRLPDIDTKYEGQRVDGTHAVNGTATAGEKTITFQCSFDKPGKRIVKFVENKPQVSDEGNGSGNGGNGGFNATGDINCAQYEGQPLRPCKFGVIRRGNGAATLTVFLPQGGKRIIQFEGGKAVSSDAPGGVTSEMKSDLITVHIGTNERYELVDAVINGG